jgi:hypothetical protein
VKLQDSGTHGLRVIRSRCLRHILAQLVGLDSTVDARRTPISTAHDLLRYPSPSIGDGEVGPPPQILSVRKVVPTLTSKSAEIVLSMAGAKQCRDIGFILVPVEGRTSSRGALVVLYCDAHWCS